MKQTLTTRQEEVLAFLRDHLAEHGYPPSLREIARGLDIRSPNGVMCHLDALERKGWISRQQKFRSRAITILGGEVPAGVTSS